MCLIAFAIGADPARPLLLAANRDEFFERPTEPLHRWALPDGTGVVAGRDLRDGGTWLGMNETGRVAMLTNVRSANPGPGRRSRGELTTRWLQDSTTWEQLLADLDPADYGGFNLVVGDLNSDFWAWIGNRNPERPHDDFQCALHHKTLGHGIYGLSNATLDTPWPKTQHLKNAVHSALVAAPSQSIDCLTSALARRIFVADRFLPETGLPIDFEQALSSPFVYIPERAYGTRSSLVMCAEAIEASGESIYNVSLTEWTHLRQDGSIISDWQKKPKVTESLFFRRKPVASTMS